MYEKLLPSGAFKMVIKGASRIKCKENHRLPQDGKSDFDTRLPNIALNFFF